jgi:hypothetical protein
VTKYIVDGGFMVLIGILGGMDFVSIDLVLIRLVIICTRVFNIGNMYIVNK